MSKLIAILFAIMATMANAQEIGVHTYTHHFDSHNGLNERNWGLYYRGEGWTAGGYRNSYRRNTLYAAKSFEAGNFALDLGVANGYQRKTKAMECTIQGNTGCWQYDTKAKSYLVPAIAASYAWDMGDGYKVRLTGVPSYEKSGLVHLSVERKF